jgi:branched-chain amino acid transport system permease protein
MMNKKIGYAVLLLAALVAPMAVYPVFLMKALCFALFACAFNLLIGFTGLLSFGHAAFYGGAGYVAATRSATCTCRSSWACCWARRSARCSVS